MVSDAAEGRGSAAHDHLLGSTVASLRHEKARYQQGVERPIGSYAAIVSAYTVAATALAAVAARRRREVTASGSDLVLATIATAKVCRVLAKDPVTSFLRAPFTTFEGQAGEAELEEEVVGTGPRHAVGELLTCPFCLGPWVAGAFVAGFTFGPRAARAAAMVGAMAAGADVVQYGFAGLQKGE